MAVERLVVSDRTAFLRRPDYRTVRVLALLGLVVLWELVTRTGCVSSLFLPAPSGVLAEGLDMARSGHSFGFRPFIIFSKKALISTVRLGIKKAQIRSGLSFVSKFPELSKISFWPIMWPV